MKRTVVFAALAAGLVMGVARRVKARALGGSSSDEEAGRWLTVTVNCPPAQLSDRLPEPLARLRDGIELRIQTAPGGRGTELAARPRNGVSTAGRAGGQDPRQVVRAALREAKSLIEAGEVVRPDAPPTTRPTPTGRLLDVVTGRAAKKGQL